MQVATDSLRHIKPVCLQQEITQTDVQFIAMVIF